MEGIKQGKHSYNNKLIIYKQLNTIYNFNIKIR